MSTTGTLRPSLATTSRSDELAISQIQMLGKIQAAIASLLTASTGLVLPVPGAPKTADYAYTPADFLILGDATAGVRTLTLPAASSVPGRLFAAMKVDSSGNAVNLASADNINGATPFALSAQYNGCLVQSDGATYWLFATNF
jgi:hypothetical protein